MKPVSLMRIAILAASAALAWAQPAPAPAWLPLEVGNTWLYRAPHRDDGVVSVHGSRNVGDRVYFEVTYFGREVLLRTEPSDGSIVALQPDTRTDLLWASLNRPVGSTYPTEINPCPTTAEIAARDTALDTPVGRFSGVVAVTYRAQCADVGATKQFYGPNAGLVRDEETSFAGPVVYELVYYRVGGTVGSAPEQSCTLALDAAQYPAGGTAEGRLTFRNTSATPVHLHFPSGQSFDVQILNSKGDVVYTWSAGRLFVQAVRDEEVGPGERTFGFTLPLAGLAPGSYLAQGYLTTEPAVCRAQTGLEILAGPAAFRLRNTRHPAGAQPGRDIIRK